MRRWIGTAGGILLTTGCISELNQVAGTGAIYHIRCSAEMAVSGMEYTARCTPDACTPSFSSGPVSHVVVTMDPGRKVLGYAERVCVQDLSRASERFGLGGPAPRDDLSKNTAD